MAEEDIQSKVTDEHRAVIGVKSDPVSVTVSDAEAKRMRAVIGDADPRWADGTGIAPPYIIAGLGGGRPRSMPSILPGGLLTQQEWKFTRDIRIGETLNAVSQIIDIKERLGGRYGYTVLVTTSTDYFDTNGEHVAAQMTTVSQFDPAAARSRD